MISAQFKKPFAEQLDYFQRKLRLPVADWRDMPGRFNDAGFFATGAMKADLVNDLYGDVLAAIRDGKGLNWFRDNFDALVKKHGWADTNAKFGDSAYVDWRARIVYQTNMATSYAAGRYAQLTNPDLLSVAPYWMYRHNDAVAHPRKWHLAWNRVTKLSTDPWWRESGHMPPNGWGCRCYVIAMSKAEAERQGAKFGQAPGEGETYEAVDKKTGEVSRVPVGIDRGWDYAPGQFAAHARAQSMAGQKMESLNRDVAVRYAELLRESPAFVAFFDRAQALSARIGAAVNGDSKHRDPIAMFIEQLPWERDLWPLAALPSIDQAALGSAQRVIYLTRTNLAEHLFTHPDTTRADYALIQRIMDSGELYQRDGESLTYLAPTSDAAREYRLGIRLMTYEGHREVYVATLFSVKTKENQSQVRNKPDRYKRVR